MMTNLITIVDRKHEHWHRSNIIIRDLDNHFIVAEFDSLEQLEFFAKTLGFTYSLDEEKQTDICGEWKTFRCSHRISNSLYGFWKLDDLPIGAKPIKALSNGSIVTCYFTNDGENILFYRPNPNAKGVYRPMALEDHLAHRRIYGSY